MKNNKLCKFSALVLAAAMVLAMIPVSALAGFTGWFSGWADAEEVSVETQTTNGTVTQPFASGTQGSTNFRIPAIVTLNDGTIVAAADARWNATTDGGGIDTLVAYSKDNGESWNYSWGAYLGDNNKQYSSSSATFIDPALATDGETVYLLVDLYPAGYSNLGYSSNSAFELQSTGSGFDENGRLRISAGNGDIATKNEDSYTFYLGTFEDGYASIYNTDGSAVKDYKVDEKFNLYKNDDLVSNLFYKDAAYQAYPQQYLYFEKSEDGGKTWSAPKLVDLKEDGEVFFGTCPGGGYVTSTGRIIFPCYDTAEIFGSMQASVIYSDDGGETWTRSAGIGTDGYTSESTVSEVKLGETNYLYLFTRSNKTGSSSVREYYVSSDNGETWEKKGDFPSDITYGEKSALGSITYSKLIDDCPAIIFSAPASTSYNSGVIYVGLVQSDGTINFKYKKTVTSDDNYFKYSDLAELGDGRVALLYESNWSNGKLAEITFEKIDIRDIVGENATITEPDIGTTEPEEPTPDTNTPVQDSGQLGIYVTASGVTSVDANKIISYSIEGADEVVAYEMTLNDGSYTGKATVQFPMPSGWEAYDETCIHGFVKETNGSIQTLDADVNENAKTVTVEIPHFSTVGIYLAAVTDIGDGNVTDVPENTVDVMLTVGETSNTYTVDGTYTNLNNTTTENGVAKISANAKTIEDTANVTYKLVTDVSTLQAGGEFYVSTSSSATEPSVKVTVETSSSGNNKSYYLKHGDKYIYPKAEQNKGSWSYNLKTSGSKNSAAVTFANSGSGFTTTTTTTWGWQQMKAYLTLSGENFGASGNTTTLYFYQKMSATKNVTDLTFTGITPGTTYVTVGEITYKIIVSKGEHTVYVQPDGSITLAKEYGTEITSNPANSSIATASVNSGVITINGIAEGSTTMETELYKITIVVANVVTVTDPSESPFVGGQTNKALNDDETKLMASKGESLTKLTISKGLIFDVDLNSAYGTDVKWEIKDTSVATVDNDGKVTAVKAGETYLIATVNGVTYKIPVVVRDDGEATASSVFHIYVGDIIDTTVYYSAYCSSELVKVMAGEVFYLRPLEGKANTEDVEELCIDFFAAPNEGYVLTQLNATVFQNTDNQYFHIRNSDGGLDTSGKGWYENTSTTGTYARRTKCFGKNKAKQLAQAAADAGCDGTLGYSYNDRTASAVVNFRSDRLPTVEKKVTKVNDKDYVEGMTAGVDDTITFEITVNRYACGAPIEYTSPTLTELAGFVFSNNTQSLTISDLLEGTDNTVSSAETRKYTVTYTISEGDLDTTITNKVDLSYTYKAKYSSGSYTKSASAEASIVAPGLTTKDIIVDFGLPVECDYSEAATYTAWTLKADSSSTNATVTNNVITYTPTKALLENGMDVVRFTNTKANAATYSFKVIPASNVLYEENFLTAEATTSGQKWEPNNGTAITTNQSNQLAKAEGEAYGFDEAYKNANADQRAWTISDLTSGQSTEKLVTKFNGNGFDLIGRCAPDSASVMLLISDADGKLVKGVYVDTRCNQQFNWVPLAHIMLDETADYTATVYAYYANATTNSTNAVAVQSAYAADDSFAALKRDLAEMGLSISDLEFITLSDTLNASAQRVSVYSTMEETTSGRVAGTHMEIDAFRVYRETNNNNYAESEQNLTYERVLDYVTELVAYTESGKAYQIEEYDSDTVGGPKNEIYLQQSTTANGHTVTFSVGNLNEIQVSLRSVDGKPVKVNINGSEKEITSTTEMYYTIQSTDKNGTFTIVNKGEGILGIGNVKLPESATVQPASELEPEVVSYSIRMALAVEPDQPVEDEPEQPVTFVPEKINVSSRSVNVLGRKLVTVSVTTSTDVAYITVNGQKVNAWNNGLSWIYQPSTLRFTFTDLLKRGESKTYEIVAYNADGVASAVYTVQG